MRQRWWRSVSGTRPIGRSECRTRPPPRGRHDGSAGPHIRSAFRPDCILRRSGTKPEECPRRHQPIIPTDHSPRTRIAPPLLAASCIPTAPSALPPSPSRPRISRAWLNATRVSSRRSVLALSISSASAVASAGSSESRSRAARAASPTLPAAFSRGAIAQTFAAAPIPAGQWHDSRPGSDPRRQRFQ
jgi:hypothetical protein